MADIYQAVRSLPFPVLAKELGIDLSRFKRRKEDWQGYCPIHNSKGNNCFAYHDTGKYHCFGCRAKGCGSIDLTKALLGVNFTAAVERLTPVASTTLAQIKSPVKAISDASEAGELKPFDGASYKKYAKPCAWLQQRVPDAAIRERYGLFYYDNPARKSAFSGRVLIPIRNLEGVQYGYLGRTPIDRAEDRQADGPIAKYLFPKDFPKSRFLFGSDQLHTFGQLPLRRVFLVESPFAVLKFASLGLPAVALFGWSVSENQLELAQRLTRAAIYLPDRNRYQDSYQTVHQLCGRIWVRCPPLPEGIDDPENMHLEQILAL